MQTLWLDSWQLWCVRKANTPGSSGVSCYAIEHTQPHLLVASLSSLCVYWSQSSPWPFQSHFGNGRQERRKRKRRKRKKEVRRLQVWIHPDYWPSFYWTTIELGPAYPFHTKVRLEWFCHCLKMAFLCKISLEGIWKMISDLLLSTDDWCGAASFGGLDQEVHKTDTKYSICI